MRNLVFYIIILSILSCKSEKKAGDIIIAVAANVQHPIAEIIRVFEKNNQTRVKSIIASSGKLTSQIMEGAPIDVFISADTRYPQILFEKGLTTGQPKIYAQGVLVLWSLDEDLALSADLSILKDGSIKKIAVANPDFAPYGKAAEEVLRNTSIYRDVKKKLVYGQNVSQTSQYIITKAVEAGFTAKSLVLSEPMKKHTNWIEIDQNLYSPILQAAVQINTMESVPEAKIFYEFLYSEKCQEIFQLYGYKLP